MSFEKELFEELNILRTNPKKYADKIRTYLKYFEGKIINIPGRKAGIATVEGPRAYEDAINYLERQKVLEPFSPSKALFRVSKDFLQKIQRKNVEDADDVDMEKLISKYGTFYGDFSRATDFGSQTPEQVLINLLVSDGDVTREQRTSLFNSSYKLVGICKGSHKSFPHCTVILKCTEFENYFDKDDNGFPEYLEEEGDSNSNTKNEPKAQPQTQPKTTEEPKSKYQPKSRYQPQTKQENKIEIEIKKEVQSYQPQTKYQPQTRYQPQTKPETPSRYQPQTRQEPRSRYQPEAKQETSSKYQPQTKEEPQSRYQPQTRGLRAKYQPQTKEEPQSGYQPQTKQETTTSRYQPQSRYQAKPKQETYQIEIRREIKPDESQTKQETHSRFQSRLGRQQLSPVVSPQRKQNERRFGHQRQFSEPDFTIGGSNNGTDGSEVVSEKRTEKIALEGGVKKKTIIVEKILKNGSVETEILTEDM